MGPVGDPEFFFFSVVASAGGEFTSTAAFSSGVRRCSSLQLILEQRSQLCDCQTPSLGGASFLEMEHIHQSRGRGQA